MIVAVVVVVGLALVVYARESRPSADASDPQVGDHWHMAYGFDICGEWIQLAGNAEEQSAEGTFINQDYARTGIHSHDDGVIHWHPNSRAAVGRRAKLDVFLDVYDVQLDSDGMTWPDEQQSQLTPVFGDKYADGEFIDGETTCTVDGEEVPGNLRVVVWDNFTDTDDGITYVASYDNIRVDNDAMVFSIAFVPDGEEVTMPPWSPDLPVLGAVDGGQVLPDGELVDESGEAPTITAGENQTGTGEGEGEAEDSGTENDG